MAQKSYIKCPYCNTITKNSDYCKNCNQLINVIKKRKEQKEKIEKQTQKNKLKKGPDAIEKFILRYKNHRYLLVRILFSILYSVWLIVMAIGGFIAWIVAAIAA